MLHNVVVINNSQCLQ